ncbi:hypothetical protein HC864_04085 [Candidatus Gracilibacteria bacterium]|nr:hypothetical protein [Candidatus Gracilibacteria bacterium]
MFSKFLVLLNIFLTIIFLSLLFFGNDSQISPSNQSIEQTKETSNSQSQIQPPFNPGLIDLSNLENKDQVVKEPSQSFSSSSSSSYESKIEQTPIESEYSLEGQACNQNQLNTECYIALNNQKIFTLKSCQSGREDGCNLYFYKIRKTTNNHLIIFKEFTNIGGIDYLEVLEFDKKFKNIKTINTFINDPSLPQSVVDYNDTKNQYQF